MSQPWPPPPDLASLKELVAAADIEGLIAEDAPLDEYDPEAKHLFDQIADYKSEELRAAVLQPILEELWSRQFALTQDQLEARRSAFERLAQQIERFFGPQAAPQVRGS